MKRRHVRRRPAPVAAPVAHSPVDAERERLYTAEELYDTPGYPESLDARAYAWSRERHTREAARVQALHDFAIDEALDAWIEGRHLVGVMGGHDLRRGDPTFASAARLGHALAQHSVVATGGGPGAMEAANLGAWLSDHDVSAVDAAATRLAVVPGFRPSIQDWVDVALEVRDGAGDRPRERTPQRSLGIPTWFYGHEPPNVFCDVIAKYFSNAIREEGLLARSNAGIVVLDGAAGTVQEIFQAATPLYYAPGDTALPPLVLVGRDHWTERVPVWATLQALAVGRPMSEALHLVDSIEEVLPLLAPPP